MNNGLEMYNPSGETIERLTSFLSSFLNLTKPTLHDFYGFHVFQQISYETTLQLTKRGVGSLQKILHGYILHIRDILQLCI